MSYRPLCDVFILARAKLKKDVDGNRQSYYGSFPSGFLSRARALLGVRHTDPVLHVCGGLVKQCLYRGFGPNDQTLDLDPKTDPDYLVDARDIGVGKVDTFPIPGEPGQVCGSGKEWVGRLWPAMMIDRPYTEADHTEYDVPADVFPANLNDLLKRALQCVEPGGRVGVLDYLWPHPGKLGKEVAVIAVGTGRNNRARWFTVFERLVRIEDTPTEEAPDTPETAEGTAGPAIAPDQTKTPRRRRHKASAPEGRGSNAVAERPIRGPGSATSAPAVEPITTGADKPSPRRRRRRTNPAPHTPSPAAPANASGLQESATECVAAKVADVCHGCKESLLVDAPGMVHYEPLTDRPNVWHSACWEQHKQRSEAAAVKKREERDRAEAREKGWPICGGCNRAVTPGQKNVDGRHFACGTPKPRRRQRKATTNMEGGFDG